MTDLAIAMFLLRFRNGRVKPTAVNKDSASGGNVRKSPDAAGKSTVYAYRQRTFRTCHFDIFVCCQDPPDQHSLTKPRGISKMSDAQAQSQRNDNSADRRARNGGPQTGSKRRGDSGPESPRAPPKRPMQSSNAGPGAGLASAAADAPSLEILFPTMYSGSGNGETVVSGAGAAAEPEDVDMMDAAPAFGTPLSFEDASPAQAAVYSLLSAHPGPFLGNTRLQRTQHDWAVKRSNISDHLADYARDLPATNRPDLEECFEMLILLIYSRGTKDDWEFAWPIDVYLKCGVEFAGSWNDEAFQTISEKWRYRAKEMQSAGASRVQLETFASLFQDAEKLERTYLMENLPPYLNTFPGVQTSADSFLLQLKKLVWTALYRDGNDAWDTVSRDLWRKFGKNASAEIFSDFNAMMESRARSGTKRPTPPDEWAFRLAWEHMDRRFAEENPSPEDQLQYNEIRMYVEELFDRYGSKQMPILNSYIEESDDGSRCSAFCQLMWTVLDMETEMAKGRVYEQWKAEIGKITDENERGQLKLRFAQMAHHRHSGWTYRVKTSAFPRPHLWASIRRRLVELGITQRAWGTFETLSETTLFLAGSGILVEPPPLRYGVDPRDYVFNELVPAFIEHELAYWGPIWDRFAVRHPMTRQKYFDAKTTIWADARTNGGPVWGPEQEEWKQNWDVFREIVVDQDPRTVVAGRFRDLRASVEEFAEIFGAFVKPQANFDDSKSRHELLGVLSKAVRERMWTIADQACAEFRMVAINKDDDGEVANYDALVDELGRNIASGGPYFAPWEPPAERQIDRDPRARGSGTDRVDIQGVWKYKGHVGQGGFGEVSCWELIDGEHSIRSRMIMKEAYTRTWDSQTWWVGEVKLRRPKEYFFAKYLTGLPNSSNIVKPFAYGIYENIKMYRIYMEYCRHGDLRHMIKQYTTEEAKADNM